MRPPAEELWCSCGSQTVPQTQCVGVDDQRKKCEAELMLSLSALCGNNKLSAHTHERGRKDVDTHRPLTTKTSLGFEEKTQ